VEKLQGYHFAQPMPIEEYLVWLSSQTGARHQA